MNAEHWLKRPNEPVTSSLAVLIARVFFSAEQRLTKDAAIFFTSDGIFDELRHQASMLVEHSELGDGIDAESLGEFIEDVESMVTHKRNEVRHYA